MLVGKKATRTRYITVLRRFVCLVFRAYRLIEAAEPFRTGISFTPEQQEAIRALWEHPLLGGTRRSGQYIYDRLAVGEDSQRDPDEDLLEDFDDTEDDTEPTSDKEESGSEDEPEDDPTTDNGQDRFAPSHEPGRAEGQEIDLHESIRTDHDVCDGACARWRPVQDPVRLFRRHSRL